MAKKMTENQVQTWISETGRKSDKLAGMPISDGQTFKFTASGKLLQQRNDVIGTKPIKWVVFVADDGTEFSVKQFARRNNGLKIPQSFVKAVYAVYNYIMDNGSLEIQVDHVDYSDGNRVVYWNCPINFAA